MSLSPLPLLSFLLLVGYSLQTETSCSHTVKASELLKGGFVTIQERPCKILKKTKESGNVKIVAFDIFTSATKEQTFQKDEEVRVPEIKFTQYRLAFVDEDGSVSLIDSEGIKDGLKLPEGSVGAAIREVFGKREINVTVMSTCDEEAIVDFENAN